MPVTFPRTRRIDPQAPNQTGSLNVNVPSIAEASSSGFAAVKTGVDKVADVFTARADRIQKEAITAADIKSTDLANQFESWSKESLAKIKLRDGDTTADYVEYDKVADEQYKKIVGEYSDVEPEFLNLIQNKIKTAYGKQESYRNIQQTEQAFKYRKAVIKDTVKLNQDSMYESSLYLDSKKPESFTTLDVSVNAIIQSRIAEGSQDGTLTYDEKGNPLWLDGAVGVMVREDVGKSVINIVKTLNNSGKVAEAKQLTEKYADYMNASDRAKLAADSDESDVKNQALSALKNMTDTEMKGKPPGQRPSLTQIDAGDYSAPVKQKMREFKDTFDRQEENEMKRKNELGMITAVNRITKKQASPSPYVSEADYINSAEGKAELEGKSASDQKTLIALAMDRKESDVKARNNLWSAYQKDTLRNMPTTEFLKNFALLNKDDKNYFEPLYKQATAPATQSEQMTLARDAVVKFDIQTDTIKNKYDQLAFPKKKKGDKDFQDPLDKERLNKAKQKIERILNDPKANYNTTQRDQIVYNALQEAIQDKENTRSELSTRLNDTIQSGRTQIQQTIDKVTGGLFAPRKIKSKPESTGPKGNGGDTAKAYEDFKKEMGRDPKDANELNEYKKLKSESN